MSMHRFIRIILRWIRHPILSYEYRKDIKEWKKKFYLRDE